MTGGATLAGLGCCCAGLGLLLYRQRQQSLSQHSRYSALATADAADDADDDDDDEVRARGPAVLSRGAHKDALRPIVVACALGGLMVCARCPIFA